MKRKFNIKPLALVLSIVILIFSMPFSVFAVQQQTSANGTSEIPYNSYTYWVDYNTSEKTPAYSKPAYRVKEVVMAADLGADSNSAFNDVATDDANNTYILDSGNSRIYILNKDYSFATTLQNFTYNGEAVTFNGANGIFVDKSGLIYVADTDNARVLIMNNTGVIQKLLLLPESDLIPNGFEYKPVKVAVDSNGYIYIACDGSYYGAILYSPETEFLGFYGANTVKASITDVITSLWKRLTSNDIKRAADEISLPYTFTDIVVGPDNFMYTSTGRSGEDIIQHGQICMLNPGGKEVLGASGVNFADYSVGSLKRQRQIQDLSGLVVDDDGFFYTFDITYGRVFWYDQDCNLISVFGGSFGDGNQQGTFYLPSGIDINNTDIVVSDSLKNSLTVFEITEYGQTVREAQLITLSGDFAAAKTQWESVIKEDMNCQLAYRGLAKAYYDLGENEKAMEYAKMGVDRETYAKAFELRRTEIIEDNFYLIALLLVLIIALVVVLVVQKRKKGIVLIKNARFKTALSSVAHPAESFRLVKEKNEGSVIISTVILVLFYVITVLNDTMGGFAFTVFDSANYNAIYVLMSTVGLVFLWTSANWLVCTLTGGIGKVKEIFVVTCYSLIPIVFARALRLILTHILTPKEGAFLDIFVIACVLYAAFMLIIGIMRVHDYEFGKFVATTIFTVIGMIIIVFLLFLVFMIAQQAFGWIETVYVEIRYR